MNVRFKSEDVCCKKPVLADAILSIDLDDEPIGLGRVPDPDNKEDPANKYKSCSLKTSLKYGGVFARLVDKLEPEWFKQVDALKASKQLDPDVKTNTLVKRTYSNKCPDEKLRNQPKENPNIRISVSFDKFPMTYPKKSLQGQQKTQIFDFDESYTEEVKTPTGTKVVTKYRPATVNGKPVDKSNLHLFVKPGARIRKGHIYMDNGNQSDNWTSWTILAGKIVIENPGAEVFGDEVGDALDDTTKVHDALAGEAADTTTEETPAADADVQSALDDLGL